MVKQVVFATRLPGQPAGRPCGTWMYGGCEGHGTANGLEWNWPKEAMNIPIWAGTIDGAKLF